MPRDNKVFNHRDPVVYVPLHAKGDVNHPDCERGAVSSSSRDGSVVFVKFDKQVEKLGWDGTTSQGCDGCDLRLEGPE